LSGGHGYLSRQYGLSVDNLLEADVVLADGKFVTASETENADLLWALRGGGGNFGVVTSFLFRTNPVGMVYAGPIAFELADAATVMHWYREFQTAAPEQLYVFCGLQAIPPGDPFPKEHWEKKVCVLLVSYNGPAAEAEGGRQHHPRSAAEVDHRLGGPDALPGASLFDGLYPKGLQ
jgi:FAD/FMN-containing dehydrogenase